MYKVMRCWVFIVIACLFFVCSLGFAEGTAKGQGESQPGWDKGEKGEKVNKGKKDKDKGYSFIKVRQEISIYKRPTISLHILSTPNHISPVISL